LSLEISPVLDADIETCIRLDFTAFLDDPVHTTIFPLGPSPTTLAYNAALDRDELSTDPNTKPMKVTDTLTGEIIAYALWKFLPQREEKDLEVRDPQLPGDVNQVLGRRLIEEGMRVRYGIMGTKPYACMYLFAFVLRGVGG
jgi:hypothetical protein